MKEFLKHKIAKLGCFLVLGLMIAALTAIVKLVLQKSGYSPAEASSTASKVGEFVGKGILTVGVLLVFVLMGFQLRRELRERSAPAQPPPLPMGPPPLPATPPAPPPLPLPQTLKTGASPGGRSLLFKSCLVLIALGVLLVVGGIGTITYLADRYEKQPKQPGEAECIEAGKFVPSYQGREAAGNTPEATRLAEEFARKLRISREVLFTEGNSGGISLSKGYFLTYCFIGQDSVAIIVHVPGLRHYSPEAKAALSDFAWMLATGEALTQAPNATRLAVATRGVMDYAAILTGTITPDEDSLKGLETRHPVNNVKPLWPYFIPGPPP